MTRKALKQAEESNITSKSKQYINTFTDILLLDKDLVRHVLYAIDIEILLPIFQSLDKENIFLLLDHLSIRTAKIIRRELDMGLIYTTSTIDH